MALKPAKPVRSLTGYHEECQIWQQKAKTDHYLDSPFMVLLAALYGNGTFAHLLGEVSYLYDCKPIEVVPLYRDAFYDNLNVC